MAENPLRPGRAGDQVLGFILPGREDLETGETACVMVLESESIAKFTNKVVPLLVIKKLIKPTLILWRQLRGRTVILIFFLLRGCTMPIQKNVIRFLIVRRNVRDTNA